MNGKVGDNTLDNYIDEAFYKWRDDPGHPTRHKWKLFNNCKDEAKRLINGAKRRKGKEKSGK